MLRLIFFINPRHVPEAPVEFWRTYWGGDVPRKKHGITFKAQRRGSRGEETVLGEVVYASRENNDVSLYVELEPEVAESLKQGLLTIRRVAD